MAKSENNVVIRVGEKNNFNHTDAEFKALEKFESKGKIFVNSNSFTTIDSRFPSIVTINPYMKFQSIQGDLSNVKACRIKVFNTDSHEFAREQEKCIEFCVENGLNILLTYMRFKRIKTAETYAGQRFRQWYEFRGGYFRPTKQTKIDLLEWVQSEVDFWHGDRNTIYQCDGSGNGCPDCMNCSILTYGMPKADIRALNLSVSGVKDAYGRQGLCQYKCPDCFAKLVTFGRRPQCDKLIKNKKMTGELKH